MLENIHASIAGDFLVLKIDLRKNGTASASGKTMVIASTRGVERLKTAKRPGLSIGVNVMVPVAKRNGKNGNGKRPAVTDLDGGETE